ncbi:MAG: kinase [Candidatus Bathyarchaeota archaeon]|nr:kinase [Candidatus Termiticorpusculum sp.]
MKVYVKTPARLHLGLIDLNGDLGRMFGGLGVAINQPNTIIHAQKTQNLFVTGEETELATTLAHRFFKTYPAKPNIHLHIEKAIPAHTGLGSGTQLALAIATALAKLSNIKASTPELALTMGRAQRTGVGTAIFQNGGFVIDGGKKQPPNTEFSPLIYQQPFPQEWRFIITIPNVQKGLCSSEEKSAFNNLPPMPATEVAKICRLTMLKLLPALVEKDLESFGEALTAIQLVTGNYFAQMQGGTYSNINVVDTLDFLKQLGVHGYGQSSWGPTVYGIVKQKDAKETLKKVRNHLSKSVGGDVFVAKANNKGATIKITQN